MVNKKIFSKFESSSIKGQVAKECVDESVKKSIKVGRWTNACKNLKPPKMK
jgi:hypothetical protein